MKKLWVTVTVGLGMTVSPALGAFGQIDMSQGPVLNQRNRGPSAPNVIPADTQFEIQLKDTLDTAKDSPGKKFKAKLVQDLTAADGTRIPMGSEIKGHVSDLEGGFHSRLLLSFDEIKTKHGWVPIAATVAGVPGEHGVQSETGPEGEIKHAKVDTRREVESAAAGAAIGALAGVAAPPRVERPLRAAEPRAGPTETAPENRSRPCSRWDRCRCGRSHRFSA